MLNNVPSTTQIPSQCADRSSWAFAIVLATKEKEMDKGVLKLTPGCNTTYPVKNSKESKEKPVIISNDSLEYEVIIIDTGFTLYLNTIAKPKNYYSLNYLEKVCLIR